MAGISTSQILIYLLAIFIVLMLLGLVHPLKSANNPFPVENFSSPDISTEEDVEGGASSLYGWGYDPIVNKRRRRRTTQRRCPHCENIFVDKTDVYIVPSSDDTCRNADITKNKDIDKYVLKSSIPPCPNMDEYARKNELPPWFNHDEWIRKEDIPPCSNPDPREWIRKSEIPSCPFPKDCPKCPECPTCPKCPPCSDRVRVVERVKYKIPEAGSSSPNSYFQTLGGWKPQLSNTDDGFIDPSSPLASNMFIDRGADERR